MSPTMYIINCDVRVRKSQIALPKILKTQVRCKKNAHYAEYHFLKLLSHSRTFICFSNIDLIYNTVRRCITYFKREEEHQYLRCGRQGVNLINIFHTLFLPIFWCQKISKKKNCQCFFSELKMLHKNCKDSPSQT